MPEGVGAGAPTPAREEGLQPYGALYCFGRRSEGFQRGTEGSEYPVDTTAEGGYSLSKKVANRGLF